MIERSEITILAEEYLDDSENYLIDIIINPGNVITVEIDNDSGVDINYCAELSRHIESKLDREVEDFELTVTSAGLTSPLKSERQYKKFEGKEIEVLTRKGEKLSGVLVSSDNDGFKVEITKMEKPEGAKRKIEVKEELSFNYDEVKYTKYKIRF